jgi:hypothetical protein
MNNKNNAKYAFYYLLSLVALVFTALSVGMVVFSIINKTIADAIINYSGSYDSQLKFAISALFIAAPIFYVISRLINQGLRRGELDKDSGIRRWLTYFILLVSFLIILGVFIGVINNFLSGELTTRFILKALTVLIISGAVFSYYLYDVKRDAAAAKDKVVLIFTGVSVVLVLAAFIAAWFFVESPATARARLLDQALVSNIYSLESAVNNFYVKTQALPDNLTAVAASGVYLDSRLLNDPDSQEPIAYHKLGDRTFEFCATFRLDSAMNGDRNYPVVYPGDNKNHRAGYQCLPGNLYAAPVKAIN